MASNTANVKFVATGDVNPAVQAFNKLEKAGKASVGRLSGTIGSSLGSALSIGAIGAAVASTISYGDSIDKAANNLGITTEYLQILKRVARETGKEFAVMEKAIVNVADSAQDALDGNTNKKNAFALLGINENDLKTLSKEGLLTKSAQGATKLPREQAEAAFSQIFGKKDASTLVSQAGALANPEGVKENLVKSGQLMSDEDIAAMVAVQDSFEDLAATMKTRLAPAIAWVMDTISDFTNGVIDLTELVGSGLGAIASMITDFDIVGLVKAWGQNFVDNIKFVFDNAWSLVTGKKSLGDVLSDGGEQVGKNVRNIVKGAFGEDNVNTFDQVIQDTLSEQAERDRQREAAAAAKKAQREQDQSALKGPVNRVANKKDNQLKGDVVGAFTNNSANAAIGGTQNLNLQYRMERLQESMADSLKEIVRLLSIQKGTTANPFPAE